MPAVKYAVRYETLQVTDAEYDLVYGMFNLEHPQKVMAIKFIRSQYKIGLKEAKDICEEIAKCPREAPVW